MMARLRPVSMAYYMHPSSISKLIDLKLVTFPVEVQRYSENVCVLLRRGKAGPNTHALKRLQVK